MAISETRIYVFYQIITEMTDGDSAGNTVQENSSVFSLIRMH